jgi:hypothetical protein
MFPLVILVMVREKPKLKKEVEAYEAELLRAAELEDLGT